MPCMTLYKRYKFLPFLCVATRNPLNAGFFMLKFNYLLLLIIAYCIKWGNSGEEIKNTCGGTRTPDLFVRSETLYPTGLHTHILFI